MEMILRRAIVDDIPLIASLFIDVRIRCLPFIEWDYSLEVMEQVFSRQVKEMEFWVAEVGGEIAGFVAFTSEEIDHLYVRPELHGRGIGTALLGKALEEANEVRLWVFQQNAKARRFYERNGFVLEFETDGQENMEKTPDARYIYRSR